MSEQLYVMDLKDAIFGETLNFGTGEVIFNPCNNPEHNHEPLENGGVVKILTMHVRDAENKHYTIVFPLDSAIVKALADMDVYYHIKKLVED